jgi:hypothetical protein
MNASRAFCPDAALPVMSQWSAKAAAGQPLFARAGPGWAVAQLRSLPANVVLEGLDRREFGFGVEQGLEGAGEPVFQIECGDAVSAGWAGTWQGSCR